MLEQKIYTNSLENCRCCESNELITIFSLTNIPLAGDFKSNRLDQDLLLPLDLLFCQYCKVVQIKQTVDLNRLFNVYAFSSSTIPALVNHFREYSNWLISKINPKKVLEVGCNDGILLEPLKNNGIKTFGVDMSENIGDIARAKNLDVRSLKFSYDKKNELKEWLGEVDLITASNAFPHNDDPNGFLETAFELLESDGTLALEVMYGGNLQTQYQWDTVYHEHLHIHTLMSLMNLFSRNGFEIYDAELVPMHAGSLRVLASKKQRKSSQNLLTIMERERETKLNEVDSWMNFAKESYRSIEKVSEKLLLKNSEGKIWAYGASGRASMWLNAAKLTYIDKVVDSSPLRAGRFMPGTSTPIVFPTQFRSEMPEFTFVTAWNYFEDIMRQHPDYKGQWIMPLPKYREM